MEIYGIVIPQQFENHHIVERMNDFLKRSGYLTVRQQWYLKDVCGIAEDVVSIPKDITLRYCEQREFDRLKANNFRTLRAYNSCVRRVNLFLEGYSE